MLISIITPVYNAASTLNRCIDSLICQGIPLELIFIDDCSNDDSREVILARQSDIEQSGCTLRFERHDSNRGVAAARNTGLSLATGDYIYWVDADDYLTADSLRKVAMQIEDRNLDICLVDFFITYGNNERTMRLPDVVSAFDAFEKMMMGVLKWNLWLFFIKRDIINKANIGFVEGQNMGEDMMFLARILQENITIYSSHIPVYHYIRTNEGAMTQNYNLTHVQQVDYNLELLIKHTLPQYKYLINFLKLNLKLPMLISTQWTQYKMWSSRYKESNKYIFQNKYLALRTKLLQYCASKKLYFIVYLYNIIVMKLIYRFLYR